MKSRIVAIGYGLYWKGSDALGPREQTAPVISQVSRHISAAWEYCPPSRKSLCGELKSSSKRADDCLNVDDYNFRLSSILGRQLVAGVVVGLRRTRRAEFHRLPLVNFFALVRRVFLLPGQRLLRLDRGWPREATKLCVALEALFSREAEVAADGLASSLIR
jgi:hypothetical protein